NTIGGMALQPDGKIVVAGGRPTPATWPVVVSDFLIVRYNSDGTLDASFRVGGEATTTFGGYDEARAVALQADGKIIAAGLGGSSDPAFDPVEGWIVPQEFAVARYHPDGSLDRSFGTAGKVLVNVGDTSGAHALALELDGNIIVVGRGGDQLGEFAVVRLIGTSTATE
ncbi:MAG: delta-60 repeat domain-containing protein, partial [Acidimicrobiia bacterium]